jgi:hypothetical protein
LEFSQRCRIFGFGHLAADILEDGIENRFQGWGLG